MESRAETKIPKKMTEFKSQPRKNYGGIFQIGGKNVKCYTKKQLKSLYPNNDFERAAEYAPGNNEGQIGILDGNENIPLFRYGSHKRLFFHEKGFVAVETGDDRYIALLKNAVLTRVIAVVACLAIVAGGLLFILNMNKGQMVANLPDDKLAAGNQPELEENAVDWQGVQPRNTGGVTKGIAIPGYKSITIDADKKDVKVNFSNPAGNPCYFVISLLLEDGTELYKSKMIQPGKGLYNITLGKPLDKGEYSATIKYETFALDGLAPMNGAQVKIALIAE